MTNQLVVTKVDDAISIFQLFKKGIPSRSTAFAIYHIMHLFRVHTIARKIGRSIMEHQIAQIKREISKDISYVIYRIVFLAEISFFNKLCDTLF